MTEKRRKALRIMGHALAALGVGPMMVLFMVAGAPHGLAGFLERKLYLALIPLVVLALCGAWLLRTSRSQPK